MFGYTYNLHNYIIFCVSIFNSSIKPNIFQWSTEIETLLHWLWIIYREVAIQIIHLCIMWNCCSYEYLYFISDFSLKLYFIDSIAILHIDSTFQNRFSQYIWSKTNTFLKWFNFWKVLEMNHSIMWTQYIFGNGIECEEWIITVKSCYFKLGISDDNFLG
jgi:hypothetical protein